MALRVLLADESSTIKKVMQLALQDFAVEVKAVANGLDVLTVAKTFSPDIIFFDVLLTKKSGYEACAELKEDKSLGKIPAVLMWSGFMELDESRAASAKADAKLEKPFDADALRSVVKKLVPKLNQNTIANFLSFPDLPEIVESPTANADSKITSEDSVVPMESLDSFESLDGDEPEEFQQVPLPRLQNQNSASFETKAEAKKVESEPWTVANLDRFKLNIPSDEISTAIDETPYDYTATRIALSSGSEEVSLEDLDTPTVKPAPRTSTQTKVTTSVPGPEASPSISPQVAEQILREQVRSVLQDVAWKVLPDIAERVVREEIAKLLKEAEKFS